MSASTQLLPTRSRRQPGPSSHQWAIHEAEIRELVGRERWTLRRVMDHFATYRQFRATPKMWKGQLQRWQLNTKHNRPIVMMEAAAEYQRCLDARIPFVFEPQGHKSIDENELLRYAGRRGWTIVNGRFVGSASRTLGDAEQQTRDETALRPPVQETAPSNPRAQARRGALAANQLLYVHPLALSRLNSPDEHRYHETAVLAVDVSLLSSFNASKWLMQPDGWVQAAKHSTLDVNLCDAIPSILWESYILRGSSDMRRAQRLFGVGIKYVCYSLVNCLPLALYKLLYVCYKVQRNGGFEFARAVLWWVSQWAQHSTYASTELATTFVAICRSQERDLQPLLAQLHRVVSERIEYLAGRGPWAQILNLQAIKMELESEPQRYIAALSLHFSRLRADTQASLPEETVCLNYLSSVYCQVGETDQATKAAARGLQLLEELDISGGLAVTFSHLSSTLGKCLWEMGHVLEAVNLVEDATTRLKEGGRGLATRELVNLDRRLHEEIHSESTASAFAQLTPGILNKYDRGVQDLGIEYQGISFGNDEKGLTDDANHRRVDSKDSQVRSARSAKRPDSDASAWREDLSSAEQDEFSLPVLNPGNDFNQLYS